MEGFAKHPQGRTWLGSQLVGPATPAGLPPESPAPSTRVWGPGLLRPAALSPAGRVARPGHAVFPEPAAKLACLGRTCGNIKGASEGAPGKPQEGGSSRSASRFWTRAGRLALHTGWEPGGDSPARHAPRRAQRGLRHVAGRCSGRGGLQQAPAGGACGLTVSEPPGPPLPSPQELWELSSSPPSGRFLEVALRTPCPLCGACPPARSSPSLCPRSTAPGRASWPTATRLWAVAIASRPAGDGLLGIVRLTSGPGSGRPPEALDSVPQRAGP